MKSIITPKVVFLFGTLALLNFSYVESSIHTKCGGSFSDKSSTISSKGGKDVTLSQFKIEGTGVVKLNENCPILILTFYSGANIGNSKGFSLTYSTNSGVYHYSPESKHYIFINSSISYTLHPPKLEESYIDCELSTFIYFPENNIYNPQKKTVITFFRDELEDCCDVLWVYNFRRSDGMWVSLSNSSGRFVAPEYLSSQISAFIQSDDVILLVFRSDGSTTGKGFRLVHYYECCYK